jgi:hypothetical protein
VIFPVASTVTTSNEKLCKRFCEVAGVVVLPVLVVGGCEWEQRDLVRSGKKGAIAKNSFQYK